MKCTVYFNGSSENPTPNKMTFFEALYFDYKVIEKNNTTRINLFIHPKEKITLSRVVIDIPYNFQFTDQVFCNGFQSWSHSKMYRVDDRIPQMRGIAKRFFQYYGDDHLFTEEKPLLYSWTYGYVLRKKQLYLVGSISENTAFTFIEYDITSNLIRLIKLCDDVELSHSFPVLDIIISQGRESRVFDSYFEAMPKTNKALDTTIGCLSGNRYGNKFTAAKIEQELESLSSFFNTPTVNEKRRVFQINEGYQSAIGDWVNPRLDFRKRISQLAQKIKAQNMMPAIWIAPFVCSKKSKIFGQQKHWLLKDKSGTVIKAGYNAQWDGWYYALDIYNAEVRDYLNEVFFTIFNKWGFDLVMADFLFAAIISPPVDKTKAQVMFDAISLLEQLVGQKKLLTSGVPLGSAFQKTAYCRISPDTHLAWDNNILKLIRKRERASTINALRTIIHRRHLNKKVFVNSSDVFILQAKGYKLNQNQRFTILLIQVLFCSQIITSDDWKRYTNEDIDQIKDLVKFLDSQILEVAEYNSDYYRVLIKKEEHFIAHINLSKSKVYISGMKSNFHLRPFESIVIKKS